MLGQAARQNSNALFGLAIQLSEKVLRALGERCRNDDAIRVLCEECRDAAHVRANGRQGSSRRFVSEFVATESFGGAAESSAQAVEREVALGEHFAARLKLAERVENDSLGVSACASILFFK